LLPGRTREVRTRSRRTHLARGARGSTERRYRPARLDPARAPGPHRGRGPGRASAASVPPSAHRADPRQPPTLLPGAGPARRGRASRGNRRRSRTRPRRSVPCRQWCDVDAAGAVGGSTGIRPAGRGRHAAGGRPRRVAEHPRRLRWQHAQPEAMEDGLVLPAHAAPDRDPHGGRSARRRRVQLRRRESQALAGRSVAARPAAFRSRRHHPRGLRRGGARIRPSTPGRSTSAHCPLPPRTPRACGRGPWRNACRASDRSRMP
jgi:hypothetical protein